MSALKTWTYVWIAIGVIVVLVVIGFLIPISNSLVSIHNSLHGARRQLVGARGDVEPLPADLESINAHLAQIDRALKPVHGYANRIAANVGSVDRSLVSVSAMLTPAAATLRDTDATLHTTSATLGAATRALAGVSQNVAAIRGLAGRIELTLARTQSAPLTGTAAIVQHVRFVNGWSARLPGRPSRDPNSLGAIVARATQILLGLRNVNGHLQSICEALPAGAVTGSLGKSPPPQPGPC